VVYLHYLEYPENGLIRFNLSKNTPVIQVKHFRYLPDYEEGFRLDFLSVSVILAPIGF
jgi:hypothetical protein